MSTPPSGIASRALIARLSSALSSWFGSQNVPHSPPAGDDVEPDLLADRAPQQLLHRGDELIDVDGLGIERLAPREGEQAMGQRRGAVRRGFRQRGVALDLAIAPLRDALLHQIKRSDNSRQQIVEIVRNSAGELADRFHLLRLAQLLLGAAQRFRRLALGGDVAAGRVDQPVLGGRGP